MEEGRVTLRAIVNWEIIPVLCGKKLYVVSEIRRFITIPVTLLSLTEALPYGYVTELDCQLAVYVMRATNVLDTQ